MKTILVLTDFSQNARNAILYALDLFPVENHQYIMLNCIDRIYTPSEVEVGDTLNESQQKDSQVAMQKEEVLINIKTGKNIIFKKITFLGFINDGVKKVSADHNASLAVMGTHGATDLATVLFGSNASSLAKYIGFPLLIVPTITD